MEKRNRLVNLKEYPEYNTTEENDETKNRVSVS